jgi:acetamidase/formamidase
MERVELVVRLHERLSIETPRAETPAGTLTLGVHEDLDEAVHIALDAMVGLIAEREGMSRSHALALASVVVDLRVTQIVNAGVRGAHALLPAGALDRASGFAPAPGP